MQHPSRAVVVTTATAAAATLLATWLVVRGSLPPDGGVAVDGGAWPWTALRWGALLSDALGLGAALAAHARLASRWMRWPAAGAAGWLALVLLTAATSEAGGPDAYLEAVSLVLFYAAVAGVALVPLGGLVLVFYVSVVLTPPRPSSSLERIVLAAGLFWTFAVVPSVLVLVDLDLAAFEGFT